VSTSNDGLAASPAKLELFMLAFFVLLAGLELPGLDAGPVLLGDFVDDLQATIAT
jgi:hypothetical protein